MRRWMVGLALGLLARSLAAEEPVLSPEVRAVPGETPTPYLRFAQPAATNVAVAGLWNRWTAQTPLVPQQGSWVLDVRKLGARPGRHEYKFVVDGRWEPGENRIFHLNDDGLLERPPDVVLHARREDATNVLVHLKQPIAPSAALQVRLEPEAKVARILVSSPREEGALRGYTLAGGVVTFLFDPAHYGVAVPPATRVAVAGNFNHWDGSGGPQGAWRLRPDHAGQRWQLSLPLDGLRAPPGEDLAFKFVLDGNRWLAPPARASNAVDDGRGNANLRIEPGAGGSTALKIVLAEPLPLDRNYHLVIDGLAERRVRHMIDPGPALDAVTSTKPLGALLDRAQRATTYRLYAPRATSVRLCLFDTPEYEVRKPAHRRLAPREDYPLWKDPADGVWEITLLGLDTGAYYSFRIDGPEGDGEGFQPDAFVGDPYALAAAHAENNGIVIDERATNRWFGGWTDQDYVAPAPQDMVIYEAHVRDLTMHPSSGVPAPLRGRYEGLLASLGTGTGLDHLKRLGVNMIEFLPVAEFNNGPTDYNWGYSTVFFFAPEASYARDPLRGSQYYEFKRLVNELHRQGFGVILDVVYNHVGSPNLFSMIDRKYHFRLTPDHHFLNFSGVGNDVRSEAPMMRRLIIDNMVHWTREFRVDGFRLDLAELIDMETLLEARKAVLAVNPRAVLISEPWSFRGNHKQQLKGTGWSAWNDDFRYRAKDFVRGQANRAAVKQVIVGSTELWTAEPLQSVNYVESHDDMALADVLSMRQDKDGRQLQPQEAAVNRLAATLVFTSLGIPMINEGQEFLRSKHGISNTYNQGDKVNAIRWTDRDRPEAAATLAWYRALIALRQSEAGRSFRPAGPPPADYYRWLEPPNERQLGYVVNAPQRLPGRGFVVLLNTDLQPGAFVVDLPPGTWRVIGNGDVLNPDGLPDHPPQSGGQTATIRVPPLHAMVLMDGF